MQTRRIYCLVPSELAAGLHDTLRRHYRESPEVEVIVERRRRDRRSGAERRSGGSLREPPASGGGSRRQGRDDRGERRRIKSSGGRRMGERRAALVPLIGDDAPPLPRRARRHADRIVFLERFAPTTEAAEDADTARLVSRLQAGESQLFSELYMRYFDRLYGYLRGALRDSHDAEDLTQQVFLSVLEGLATYEIRREPFRNWLFVIARNKALSHLRKQGRIDPEENETLERLRDQEGNGNDVHAGDTLGWITDSELLLFIERLPETQRQVLMLRYMLDLPYRDIARVLDRTPTDIKTIHHRAVLFLRKRLAAVGRGPSRRPAGALRVFRPAEVLRHRRFVLR